MLSYSCDQCGGSVSPSLRYVIVADTTERHFCALICLTGWANKTGVRTPAALSEPPKPAHTVRDLIRSQDAPAAPAPPARRGQDTVERTCEICGRIGTRRFTQTDTGWRCSSTATACPGNDPPPVRKVPNPALYTDLDKPITPNPEPSKVAGSPPSSIAIIVPVPDEPEPLKTAGQPHAPTATAHCNDCTRTFTLTGRVLRHAVEMHELKHGHIVTITESEGA